MQDITAYVIVSVVHYLVVAVGFGLVGFSHIPRQEMDTDACRHRGYCAVVPEFLQQAGHMLHAPCADMNS